ncbi:hypothetical protein O181_046665 [Austropuccinia psidii MF-1]|uniref:Flavin reductase like domain-containing protein n=1 Tax=Austropuccinia psidii MF-1 TaxID=1389203 RepID=A0A9Q3HMF0_9BASI|nr:hypothetical protein [Austropuccinia psidii MF-1]
MSPGFIKPILKIKEINLMRNLKSIHFSSHSFKTFCSDRSNQDLRGIMRQLAYPVTILTVSLKSNQTHGSTISSFNSIALKPYPLISFSIKLPSRLANHLQENPQSQFSIYLLQSNSPQASLATLFSNPRHQLSPQIFNQLEKDCLGKLNCCLFKQVDLPLQSDSSGSHIQKTNHQSFNLIESYVALFELDQHAHIHLYDLKFLTALETLQLVLEGKQSSTK